MTDALLDIGELGEEHWSVLERIARSVHAPSADYQATLDGLVACAVEIIDGADWAGLILVKDGQLVPCAISGAPPLELDTLQSLSGVGPCIDAANDQQVITIDNTADDLRWPEFITRARDLDVGSMLCVPLQLGAEIGSLSLYAAEPHAFGKQSLALARLFAVQAALVLDDARRVAQLKAAVASRDLIGQAKGILMERHRVTADVAFSLLRRASQTTNTKLADVARQLTETGELAGAAL